MLDIRGGCYVAPSHIIFLIAYFYQQHAAKLIEAVDRLTQGSEYDVQWTAQMWESI